MSIIESEIREIQELCENVVPTSKIIACITEAPTPLVRVHIQVNKVQRQLTVCLHFPTNYPEQFILVEIKSKTLSSKFLGGLTTLCEQKAKEWVGKCHCLQMLCFIEQYVRDNPLCVCFDEIQLLRRAIECSSGNCLKLKQKTSTVHLVITADNYYYSVKAIVPENYPLQCILLQDQQTNLPPVLYRYLNGQSREIARQCVEAPLCKLQKEKIKNFQPTPSLFKALKFCVDATTALPNEKCPVCEDFVLPKDPNNLEMDENRDKFVERVYCGHLFHQGCLKLYMREPPFPKGGKLCPAKQRHFRSDITYNATNKTSDTLNRNYGECGIRLAHDRWVVNVKEAEARWAQKQARQRELEEVMDFLK